jgi:small-conductance mechanosensitive channel
MALSDILLRAETTFQNVSFYLNKVVIVLVIIFAGFIIGKIIESILRRIFVKVGLDDKLTNIFKARRNYSRAIRRSVVRLIYLCTVLYALSKLAVLEEVFAIVVILVIFAILASWILAGIDVIPNLLARMQLHGRGIAVGNEVSVMHNTGMIQGLVVDMTLTDVRVKRKNGDLFFIPNAVFLESVVKRHR